VPLPSGIFETPETFGVDWQATYTLDGDAFTVADADVASPRSWATRSTRSDAWGA
jgi:hypothetical protein